MSKFKGRGATVIKQKPAYVITDGEHCIVICWSPTVRKYMVDLGGGLNGWYKRSELRMDD